MAQPFSPATIAAYLARTRQIESNGNNRAVSPTGAAGPYQFTKGTARAMHLSLADRFDLTKSGEAAARLAQENAASLQRTLGRTPTHGEVYLAHQQGAAGAAALLKYPNLPAAQALVKGGAYSSIRAAEHAIKVNGGAGMTGGQFANKWTSKFDGNAPVQAARVEGVDPSKSPAFRKQFDAPAPVQTTAATPAQIANPRIEPKPATTLLSSLNPVSSARAGEAPRGSVLNDLNPKDPSGPLLADKPQAPAPQAAPAGARFSGGAGINGEGDAAFKNAYLESIKQPQATRSIAPPPAAPPSRQDIMDNRMRSMETMSPSEVMDRVGKRGWGDIDNRAVAPVAAAPATPEQRANPRLDALLNRSPETPYAMPADLGGAAPKQIRESSLQPAPLQHPIGIYHGAPGGPIDMNRPNMPGMARDLVAPGNLPLPDARLPATAMAQPTPIQQLPAIDVGRIPQGPGNGYQPATPQLAPNVGPFNPDVAPPMVSPVTQETPPSITPETISDPGPGFTPAAEAPVEMPTVGAEGGGDGGMGGLASGLLEALSNLGGGGEGGGGGGSVPVSPQITGGVGGMSAIPDFPSAGAMTLPTIAQRGQMVSAVPQLGAQAPLFNVKPIGQAAQMAQADSGQANLATKRLFG